MIIEKAYTQHKHLHVSTNNNKKGMRLIQAFIHFHTKQCYNKVYSVIIKGHVIESIIIKDYMKHLVWIVENECLVL